MLQSSMEGYELTKWKGATCSWFETVRLALLLWLGPALWSLTWEHEGREADSLMTPQAYERKQEIRFVEPNLCKC